MKELILNEDKLKSKEIDDYVTRVKAIIVNDKKELLLGFSYNDYQFPGGHLEKDEEPVKGLIRELKEETGMDIEKEELEPFMMIKHLSKNYFNKGKNRCNVILYYICNTNKTVDMSKTCYTDFEKKGNFKLVYVPLEKAEETLIDQANKCPSFRPIAYEMLGVLTEYIKENL